MTPVDDNFVSFERKKEKNCTMKIKESVLISIFKNNLKYLIFLVLSILLLIVAKCKELKNYEVLKTTLYISP